jgi:hypothetical protein
MGDGKVRAGPRFEDALKLGHLVDPKDFQRVHPRLVQAFFGIGP